MLASQTYDGDLRVWSVPKEGGDVPNIIRVLQCSEVPVPGACWFAWSKNGRLIQYCDGETRAWDVRTKKVTYDIIPTIDGVVGIANYGPSATLFTLGRNHTVQQYDINPSSVPLQVATAQHVPANTPPTPPTTLEDRSKIQAESGASQPYTDTESSADESTNLSPLQKIAREMESLDALESEIRDKVMPLSSRSSNAGSISSGGSSHKGRRQRKYLYDRPDSSRASTSTGFDGTEFSFGPPPKTGHESMSIRSTTSCNSQAPAPAPSLHNRRPSSGLRKEILQSPEEKQDGAPFELFPCVKATLRQVAFRTPHYGETARTPELLQREMLSVVFGWNDDARSLVHEELSRHGAGSTNGVLLSRWLGDISADQMAALIGSKSMTSSDWMLLALSSIGPDSQKKASEAFIQRLLEKGDIHPAVGILVGIGEIDEAIEVYVSQSAWMEAVLLICLYRGHDWQRTSWLLRKWGESAVMNGEAELAVRCFSCTSIETSAPWTSPRAQDACNVAQHEQRSQPQSAGALSSPTYSLPSRSGSGRLTQKNASLKLITSFGDRGAPLQTNIREPGSAIDPATVTAGVTPIGVSAFPMSPGGLDPFKNNWVRTARDPTSAKTATPGGYTRKKRLPSRHDIERAKQEVVEMATPLTAARDFGGADAASQSGSKRSNSVGSVPEPATALRPNTYDAEKLAPRTFGERADHLPSPAHSAFTRLRQESRNRGASRERNHDRLAVQVVPTVFTDELSPTMERNEAIAQNRTGTLSPPLTGGSSKASVKSARATDEYVSSVEEARNVARHERAESRRRTESRKPGESRSGRTRSRMREASENRGCDVRYIKPAKRSPSSPVSMSPEELAKAQAEKSEAATTDDENFYKVASPMMSPVESHKSARSGKSDPRARRRASEDKTAIQPPRTSSRAPPEAPKADTSGRGRSQTRTPGPTTRSPSSPLPVLSDKAFVPEEETQSDGQRFRLRTQSASRKAGDDLQARREASRTRRERSTSRKPPRRDDSEYGIATQAIPEDGYLPQGSLASIPSSINTHSTDSKNSGLSRKELAAQELEERRLSLLRRPSAPQVPHPGQLQTQGLARPSLAPRSNTDLGDSPTSFGIIRSHTIDADQMQKYGRITGTSTPSAPIGLPATPRAMRHPKYMSSDPSDDIPTVPDIPGKFSDLSLSGSSLSQVTGSALSQVSSVVSTNPRYSYGMQSSNQIPISSSMTSETNDSLGPLLPSSVFTAGSKSSGGPRSATAPPESTSAPVHPAYKSGLSSTARRLSHVRKISPPDVMLSTEGAQDYSIEAALYSPDANGVIIIPETPVTDEPASVMPELQHLAMPPPPPPPPSMFSQPSSSASGMISIAIDENAPTSAVETHAPALPQAPPIPQPRSATSSPTAHRRNQGSISEGFGARFRGLGDRMRSSSRNRTKSPQTDKGVAPYESFPMPTQTHPAERQPSGPAPYESVQMPNRAQSPYEQAMAAQKGRDRRPSFGVPASPQQGLNEQSIPPNSLPGSRNGYRNPKEIRANMPPDYVQHGVYPPGGGFL